MSEVKMQEVIEAPAVDVWKTISDFNGAGAYIGGIAHSSIEGDGIGAVRTITMKNGAQVRERLEHVDPASFTLRYAIIDGEIPLNHYLATMQLLDLNNGTCQLNWSSTFMPNGATESEAEALIVGIYTAGFKGLKRLFSPA